MSRSRATFILVLIILLVIILGYFVFKNSKTENTNIFATNITEKTNQNIAGFLDYSDKWDGLNSIYFQPLGKEKYEVFKSSFIEDTPSIYYQKVPYYVKDKNIHSFYIWDYKTNSSTLLFSKELTESTRIVSMILSKDNQKFYYNTVINSDEDADNLTTKIFEYNIENNNLNEIFSQTEKHGMINIKEISEDKLIMTTYSTEEDRQNIKIFDIKKKNFIKDINSDFFWTYDLSSDGKYLAYAPLDSKTGDFTPTNIKILNLENLEYLDTSFIKDLELPESFNQGLNFWKIFLYMTWGSDNSNIYFIYEDINSNENKRNRDVYSIDLMAKKLHKEFSISSDLNYVSALYVFQNNFLIESISDDKKQIWSYPENKLLTEFDYKSNIKIVLE